MAQESIERWRPGYRDLGLAAGQFVHPHRSEHDYDYHELANGRRDRCLAVVQAGAAFAEDRSPDEAMARAASAATEGFRAELTSLRGPLAQLRGEASDGRDEGAQVTGRKAGDLLVKVRAKCAKAGVRVDTWTLYGHEY